MNPSPTKRLIGKLRAAVRHTKAQTTTLPDNGVAGPTMIHWIAAEARLKGALLMQEALRRERKS